METNAGRNHAEITASRCSFLGARSIPGASCCLRGTESLRLRPRTYDVLLHLARNAGRLVSKQELMDVVWKDVAVTDDSLVQCLMEIRRALGDAEHVIETVRGRGYLFNTAVRWTADEAVGSLAAEPAVSSGSTSPTEACRRDIGTALDAVPSSTHRRMRGVAPGDRRPHLDGSIPGRPALRSWAAHSRDRGSAAREPVARSGTGVLRRWHDGRPHHGALEDQRAARDLPHVGHAI